jgi:hypothetical protein
MLSPSDREKDRFSAYTEIPKRRLVCGETPFLKHENVSETTNVLAVIYLVNYPRFYPINYGEVQYTLFCQSGVEVVHSCTQRGNLH